MYKRMAHHARHGEHQMHMLKSLMKGAASWCVSVEFPLLAIGLVILMASCANQSSQAFQAFSQEVHSQTLVDNSPPAPLASPDTPQYLEWTGGEMFHLSDDALCFTMLPTIYFEFDQATLTPDAIRSLQALGSLLRYCHTMMVEIEGHTDWCGSEVYNLGLANRRARAVIYYLVYDEGIEAERIVSPSQLSQGILAGETYGELMPIASNTIEIGRTQNRRVQCVKTIW